MTTQPLEPPHPLTVAEYLEIGEIELGYTELVNGRLEMSPSPSRRHNKAGARLWRQLEDQLPPGLSIEQDIDVDLELAPPDEPGFVRRPDIIVTSQAAADRVDREGGLVRASEVLVVVEIISPGSRRADLVSKRSEYADAGIPHYWIIDATRSVSLTACHLAVKVGYKDAGPVTGTSTTVEPFRAVIDLGSLI